METTGTTVETVAKVGNGCSGKFLRRIARADRPFRPDTGRGSHGNVFGSNLEKYAVVVMRSAIVVKSRISSSGPGRRGLLPFDFPSRNGIYEVIINYCQPSCKRTLVNSHADTAEKKLFMGLHDSDKPVFQCRCFIRV